MVVWFVAGLLFLGVRELVVPRVGQYRAEVAAAIGEVVGRPVTIESLSADLTGWRPRLHLRGFELRDEAGRTALRLETLDATIAWSSVLLGQARFHRIELNGPELALRREADGSVFVAGVRVDMGAPDAGFADWLLAQREIVVRNARLTWNDALRAAPELRLDGVTLRLLHQGHRLRVGLQARPPDLLATRLEVRGDLASATPLELASWRGQIFVAADNASLGGWRHWVDYPFPVDGSGSLRAWIGTEAGRVTALTTDLSLHDLAARFAPDLPELALKSVSGRLTARDVENRLELAASALQARTTDGANIEPTDFDLAVLGADRSVPESVRFSINRLDFAALADVAEHLPFDAAIRQRLAAFAPRGRVENLRLGWQGAAAAPLAWQVSAQFFDLGLAPQGALPGMAGISGEVSGDAEAGRYRLRGKGAVLDLPAIFPEPRLGFSSLQAEGGWSRRNGRLEVALDSAGFENPDAAGTASGRYWPETDGPGEIDLTARLTRAESGAVWRYLPRVVNDDTRTWLRHGIVGGRVPEARLRLKGPLARFPFRDGKSGQFLVTTRVFGARLDYAEGWPSITGIDGEVRFEGPGMRITAERAKIFGVALAGVVAEVPDLDAPGGEMMNIRGRAAGPTADFLRFVSESPVSRRIDGFTDGMRAEGAGNLDLRLVLPLRNMDASTVRGEYRFAGNRVSVVDGLAPLTEASGLVRFTESDLAIPEAAARLYGEPMRLMAETVANGGVNFDVSGGARMQAVRETHDWPLLGHLSGAASWRARIGVRTQGVHVAVDSDLLGVTSSLPAPMNKSATQPWPVRVEVDFPAGRVREELRVALEQRGEFRVVREHGADGWNITRAALGFGAPVPGGERGLMAAVALNELDIDAWRQALYLVRADEGVGSGGAALAMNLDLKARELRALGQSFGDVRLAARSDKGGWVGNIVSHEAEGEFDWRSEGDGTLRARLKRLVLGADKADALEDADSSDDEAPRRLPALDCVVDRFSVRGLELGRLALKARNSAGTWHLDSVLLENPDGRLSGSGAWSTAGRPRTELDFRLEARHVGPLAARLGYGEVMRGGKAVLAGRLGWRGAPTRIDYPTLAGSMMVEAEDGQFRKLDPGMGRLLGVLSLQALPRRLTLDFRDVFSEGFAFDRISGSIAASAGVLRTDNLEIRGPSARVRMSGSVNLDQETQDLRVQIQPTLAESVALGTAAGLINPVAGVVAYVAQKALSDPIEKLFAFSYAITGAWADPRVEKLSSAASSSAPPRKDQESNQ